MTIELQKPYIYSSLDEVPPAIKEQLRNILAQGSFSLSDFNNYIRRAYELQYLNGDVYIPNWGMAKQEFLQLNIAKDGAWWPKDKVEQS